MNENILFLVRSQIHKFTQTTIYVGIILRYFFLVFCILRNQSSIREGNKKNKDSVAEDVVKWDCKDICVFLHRKGIPELVA